MKPPYDQRLRWSAPTARTRTPIIHAPLHPVRRSEDRDSMYPSQPRGWLLGQRRARRGAWSALRASLRGSLDGAATLRALTDRARIPANREDARAPQTARQRSASPRTTRKDPGSGKAARTGIAFFETARLGGALFGERAAAYWASAFSAAISAFMSSSAFEGRHGSPRLANSIARPAPWAVCAASCATI